MAKRLECSESNSTVNTETASTITDYFNFNIFFFTASSWDTRWRSWLRHYAASRKIAVVDSRWCHWNILLK